MCAVDRMWDPIKHQSRICLVSTGRMVPFKLPKLLRGQIRYVGKGDTASLVLNMRLKLPHWDQERRAFSGISLFLEVEADGVTPRIPLTPCASLIGSQALAIGRRASLVLSPSSSEMPRGSVKTMRVRPKRLPWLRREWRIGLSWSDWCLACR